MRSGEAWNLKWIDFDFEREQVMVTPEKRGRPRLLPITNNLVAMLKMLSTKNAGTNSFEGSLRHLARTFRRNRAKTARKLNNPRINQTTFHTFRHWKATMEYHRTKDILPVKELLGHRNIQSTLMIAQLVNLENDSFHSAVAKNVEEACKLVDAGFDYVTGDYDDGGKIFRKRK